MRLHLADSEPTGENTMRVLVAIPVFNEARYVEDVLREIIAQGHDVLVVDDGSTDETPEILRRFSDIALIRHPENRGYGQSLIDAFAYASCKGYDWIITIDCDEQHEPALIPAFVKCAARDDADIISGSRYMMKMPGNTDPPGDRRRINMTITELLNQRLHLRLTDSFCGFKAYRISAMDLLCLTTPGYAFPLQFWVQAARRRLRIRELPVPLIYNDPNRHFGGILDDPDARLRHYLDVFEQEMARPACDEARTVCAGNAS
ncbi:MAG TPA: glycosyltransferase family 2 protein [Phycisphaerae bacterium]|nr:glycosyltransferase family 2 protein [Phycisphaerae bacterium]